jgi:hypothetical protein
MLCRSGFDTRRRRGRTRPWRGQRQQHFTFTIEKIMPAPHDILDTENIPASIMPKETLHFS